MVCINLPVIGHNDYLSYRFSLFSSPFLSTTAVSVGFEMAQYSISEVTNTPPLVIQIVREDSLTSTQSFNITVVIDNSSNATNGVYIFYYYNSLKGVLEMSSDFHVL